MPKRCVHSHDNRAHMECYSSWTHDYSYIRTAVGHVIKYNTYVQNVIINCTTLHSYFESVTVRGTHAIATEVQLADRTIKNTFRVVQLVKRTTSLVFRMLQIVENMSLLNSEYLQFVGYITTPACRVLQFRVLQFSEHMTTLTYRVLMFVEQGWNTRRQSHTVLQLAKKTFTHSVCSLESMATVTHLLPLTALQLVEHVP